MTRRVLMSIHGKSSASAIRTQQFKGTDHIVIPITALVEGVLSGAASVAPELALASEFAKVVEGWNGRPVLLNHPMIDAQYVSANLISVQEEQVFGMIFNAKLEDNRLEVEAWIDTERLKEIGGEAEILVNKIKDGEVQAEVSTGLFTTLEESEGVYKGQEFSSIWREVVPDHLAILSEGTIGACSIEDGCGTPPVVNMRVLAEGLSPNDCGCGCNSANTCKTPKGAVAMPMKKGDKGKPKPKPNAGQEVVEDLEKGIFEGLMAKFRSLISFRDNELSDRDRHTALMNALTAEASESWCYIIATYSDHFVYVEGWQETMYSRNYAIDDKGAITLESEKVQVRPVTEFVPVEIKAKEASSSTTVANSGKEEKEMKTREQRVQALIDNKATKFTDDDRAWLTTLEEAVLDKLEPEEISSGEGDTNVDGGAAPAADGQSPAAAPVANSAAKPVTTDEYIASAPAEIRALLESSLRLQRERRANLEKSVKANTKLTDADLKAMSDDMLERIMQSVAPVYAGQGAGGSVDAHGTHMSTNSDNDAFVPAPKVFEAKAS